MIELTKFMILALVYICIKSTVRVVSLMHEHVSVTAESRHGFSIHNESSIRGPIPVLYGTSECSTSLIYYNDCSLITYIYDTRACYVCIMINISDTLFMHSPFSPLTCATFVYDY